MKHLLSLCAALCATLAILAAAGAQPAAAAPVRPGAAAAALAPGVSAAAVTPVVTHVRARWVNRCLRPARTRPFYCKRRAALRWALAQRGCWYVWAGAGPCSRGFDCSGLVMAAFSTVGIGLPHFTGAMQTDWRLRRTGVPRPGDIILYGYPAFHAAMVVRRGWEVDAPHTGERVQEQRIEAGAQYYAIV